MAVIWQRKSGGVHYQVRTAGNTRRLYTNNICHSQYNPGHLFTGSIWDLLFLPALFLKHTRSLRVLVLGVAGGAVIRQLLEIMDIDTITAIERDPVHCYIAKRFFDLDDERVIQVQADARVWVEDYSGDGFDLIIDDVFLEQDQQPVRAIVANSDWVSRLHHMLNQHGILIMNYASKQEFRQSALFLDQGIKKLFRSFYQLTLPTLENHVACLSQSKNQTRILNEEILQEPKLEKAFRAKQLKYRIRKIY